MRLAARPPRIMVRGFGLLHLGSQRRSLSGFVQGWAVNSLPGTRRPSSRLRSWSRRARW